MSDQALSRCVRVLLLFNCLLGGAWAFSEILPAPQAATSPEFHAPAPDLPDWPFHKSEGVVA